MRASERDRRNLALKSYDKLNPAQREAVTHGEGPLLVIAGPGSGKTFVLTQRVRYLTEECGARPQSVLVLTFSRAAAREMEERYRKTVGSERTGVCFGTFHAFFFRILRTAYGYQADQVIGEEERRALVSAALRRRKTESGDFRSLVQNVLSEIALVKEERAELSNYYSVSCPAEQFREIYREYENALAELRKIDYEDMLRMCYELLKERADIRAALSARYNWLLVDEFQDINRLQYEIVRMIAGKRANLMIVGDDDQSIYRFRGAAPELMLNFTKDYPRAAKVVLNVNYRSTPEIVKTAGRLIARNKTRFPKEIKAARPSGKPVNTVVCPTPQAETDYLVREIRALTKQGARYDSIAVLYRTNLQPRLLARRLYRENIPFRMREMLPDLGEHWIARDLLAYLRLAGDAAEPGDLLRIMNRPNRYIRREAVRMEGESLSGLRVHYEKSGEHWMDERLGRFGRDLRALSRMRPAEAIAYIRGEIGYDDFLRKYAEEREIEESELFDILEEIEASAEGFATLADWRADGQAFNAAVTARSKAQEDGDEVQLMTYHASKGLEFPTVFLLDVNEGIVPHRKANSREELEEERRMFYVAMTRAKDELRILTCKTRFRRQAEESRFVREYESR